MLLLLFLLAERHVGTAAGMRARAPARRAVAHQDLSLAAAAPLRRAQRAFPLVGVLVASEGLSRLSCWIGMLRCVLCQVVWPVFSGLRALPLVPLTICHSVPR